MTQLRGLRAHLASTAMEKQQQDSSCGQLEKLLADSRRENKLLKEEVHALKQQLDALSQDKVSVVIQFNCFRAVQCALCFEKKGKQHLQIGLN